VWLEIDEHGYVDLRAIATALVLSGGAPADGATRRPADISGGASV
jgi:hypothetical protein